MSKVLVKALKGSDRQDRSTRFHDENNVFMGWAEFRHLPATLYTLAHRKLLGRLPEMPWWPYPAIEAIDRLLDRDSVVLEFGIGMSTLWLARRAGRVYGVEGAPEWYEEMTKRLHDAGLDNVTLLLRDSTRYPDRGNYSDQFNEVFSSLDGIPEPQLDLVIVDGAARWRCVEKALPAIRPGGFLYLDNSDADKDWAHYTRPGLAKEAQKRLEAAEQAGEGTCQYFRGLAPATLIATEGTLFQRRW
jgi:hypothetical protein